jgi:hypothetical protein
MNLNVIENFNKMRGPKRELKANSELIPIQRQELKVVNVNKECRYGWNWENNRCNTMIEECKYGWNWKKVRCNTFEERDVVSDEKNTSLSFSVSGVYESCEKCYGPDGCGKHKDIGTCLTNENKKKGCKWTGCNENNNYFKRNDDKIIYSNVPNNTKTDIKVGDGKQTSKSLESKYMGTLSECVDKCNEYNLCLGFNRDDTISDNTKGECYLKSGKGKMRSSNNKYRYYGKTSPNLSNYESVIREKLIKNKNFRDKCFIHQFNNEQGGLKNSDGKAYNLYNFMDSNSPKTYIDSKVCLADDIYQKCGDDQGGNQELYDLIMKQKTLKDAYFEYNFEIVNNKKCQENKPLWHPDNCPGPTSGSTKCWADKGYHECNQNQEIYNYIDGGGDKIKRYPKEMYKRYKEVTEKNKCNFPLIKSEQKDKQELFNRHCEPKEENKIIKKLNQGTCINPDINVKNINYINNLLEPKIEKKKIPNFELHTLSKKAKVVELKKNKINMNKKEYNAYIQDVNDNAKNNMDVNEYEKFIEEQEEIGLELKNQNNDFINSMQNALKEREKRDIEIQKLLETQNKKIMELNNKKNTTIINNGKPESKLKYVIYFILFIIILVMGYFLTRKFIIVA